MLIIILVLIGSGLFLSSWYFDRHFLKNLEISVFLEKKRASLEEEFDLCVEMSNTKWMILPHIQIHIQTPEALQFQNQKKHHLTFHTSLLFHQKMRRRFRFQATERGYFELKVHFEVADFLGFSHHFFHEKTCAIIIHPTINSHHPLIQKHSGIQGDVLVQRWIFPDPIFYTGNRPYERRDAFKEIDWKAFARLNEYRTKQHDFTASFQATLCLFVENSENLYADNSDYVESAIDFSAALIHQANQKQEAVALMTNAVLKTELPACHYPDSGQNHIIRCMDTLACITPYQKNSSLKMIQRAYEVSEPGNECYFIANQLFPLLLTSLGNFVRKGIKVSLVLYDTHAVCPLKEIDVLSLARRDSE